ncbi:putative 6-phosphogluconolactonase, partial [Lachnellula willkommii]
MRWQHLPLGGLVASSVAVNLYVSSYIGNITTLSLSRDANGSYSLTAVAANNGSSPSPTWLEKDRYNGIIYGLDEGLTGPNGSISSYKTSASGELTQIDRHVTLGGPVSSIVYNGGKAIAVAHYGGSAVSSWTIQESGGLALLQNFQFTLSAPGTIPDRQDAPHPHEALVDPTDQFIVVPDLGADYIRVFSI